MARYLLVMFTRSSFRLQTATIALGVVAESARAGFVCMVSSADEFEHAVISERRAQGRYRRPSWLPIGMFVGPTLMVAGAALLMI